MGNGKQLKEYESRKTILDLKVGSYIRWRALPLALTEAPSAFKTQTKETERFVEVENRWQYGIILDILYSPRHISAPYKKGIIPGTHIKLLMQDGTDWIFNFELFNEIEIVSD
tara:strand:+ start:3861 stop:4199 length:339 start_codon:yes stop_codon:yes gene_type:complete